MAALVLTLIGDDRAGLVHAVAEAVAEHGGNWEESQMSELAGKFAGVVLVTVPEERVAELTEAIRPLEGLLDISVHRAADGEPDRSAIARYELALIGTDRPGIVSEVTAVLTASGVSIERLVTSTREAPMAGERLFEASARLNAVDDREIDPLREALESLATDLMVDIDLDPVA